MIYGAGEAGSTLANSINQSKKQVLVGFLDDDERLQGRNLHEHLVFSPMEKEQLVKDKKVDYILAIPSIGRRRRNQIISEIRKISVAVRTVPSLVELATGMVSASEIRDLEIGGPTWPGACLSKC